MGMRTPSQLATANTTALICSQKTFGTLAYTGVDKRGTASWTLQTGAFPVVDQGPRPTCINYICAVQACVAYARANRNALSTKVHLSWWNLFNIMYCINIEKIKKNDNSQKRYEHYFILQRTNEAMYTWLHICDCIAYKNAMKSRNATLGLHCRAWLTFYLCYREPSTRLTYCGCHTKNTPINTLS